MNNLVIPQWNSISSIFESYLLHEMKWMKFNFEYDWLKEKWNGNIVEFHKEK